MRASRTKTRSHGRPLTYAPVGPSPVQASWTKTRSHGRPLPYAPVGPSPMQASWTKTRSHGRSLPSAPVGPSPVQASWMKTSCPLPCDLADADQVIWPPPPLHTYPTSTSQVSWTQIGFDGWPLPYTSEGACTRSRSVTPILHTGALDEDH